MESRTSKLERTDTMMEAETEMTRTTEFTRKTTNLDRSPDTIMEADNNAATPTARPISTVTQNRRKSSLLGFFFGEAAEEPAQKPPEIFRVKGKRILDADVDPIPSGKRRREN